MREIKFRIIYKDKIVGYEHLTETGWKWNWIELNPDKGERWSRGVIEDSTPTAMIRNQFTGLKDKNGVEIYEGDQLFITAGYSSVVKFEDGMFVSVYSHPEDGETIPLIDAIGKDTEIV